MYNITTIIRNQTLLKYLIMLTLPNQLLIDAGLCHPNVHKCTKERLDQYNLAAVN